MKRRSSGGCRRFRWLIDARLLTSLAAGRLGLGLILWQDEREARCGSD
jgi:hypothetical protein